MRFATRAELLPVAALFPPAADSSRDGGSRCPVRDVGKNVAVLGIPAADGWRGPRDSGGRPGCSREERGPRVMAERRA